VIELLAAAVRLATPVSFVALGELVGERAGILNIGMEGIMLAGCLAAAGGAIATGSAGLGLLAGAAAGLVVVAVMAALCVGLQADQVVVGLGVDLAALGLTTLASRNVPAVAETPGLEPLRIPVLSDLPGLGPVLLGQAPTVPLLVLLAVAVSVVLTRSGWGLRVRAAGDAPEAAYAAGVAVARVRVQAMLVSGALAGLGGAALALGDLHGFTENMVAGRGFLALAAVIVGRWTPWPVVGACLLFGAADALRFRLPGVVDVPPSLLLMLPYVLALVAVSLQRGSARAPAALARPFGGPR